MSHMETNPPARRSPVEAMIDAACGIPSPSQKAEARKAVEQVVANAAREGAEYALGFLDMEKDPRAFGLLHSVSDAIVFSMMNAEKP